MEGLTRGEIEGSKAELLPRGESNMGRKEEIRGERERTDRISAPRDGRGKESVRGKKEILGVRLGDISGIFKVGGVRDTSNIGRGKGGT